MPDKRIENLHTALNEVERGIITPMDFLVYATEILAEFDVTQRRQLMESAFDAGVKKGSNISG